MARRSSDENEGSTPRRLSDRSVDDLIEEKVCLIADDEESGGVGARRAIASTSPHGRGHRIILLLACCIGGVVLAWLLVDENPIRADEVDVHRASPKDDDAPAFVGTPSSAPAVSPPSLLSRDEIFPREEEPPSDPTDHNLNGGNDGLSPSTTVIDRESIRAAQIQNYKDGKALMLNIHITHHAGTTFCALMNKVGQVPDFACMGGADWPKDLDKEHPWSFDKTGEKAAAIREHFHMWSWEFAHPDSRRPLADVNWEDPRVLSVIIMRNPMDRALAGDAFTNRNFGADEATRTFDQWWGLAKSKQTNNYALNILTRNGCGYEGENTTTACLEEAKELVRRFTYVLDQDCLSESMVAFAKELGFELPPLKKARYHPPVRDRINNTEIYNYMRHRMRRDLELYSWSKSLSLVNCSAIKSEPELPDSDKVSPRPSGSKTTDHNLNGGNDDGVVPATTAIDRESIRAAQIQNYKDGKALMLNIHITHHAGTYFCGQMKQVGPTPEFACMGGANWPNGLDKKHPWKFDKSGEKAAAIREHFHMWSWEFGKQPNPPLADVNWEDPRVLSVIIMRNPMDRALAGDANTARNFGPEAERTTEKWWGLANAYQSNNFALTKLTRNGCGQRGANTTLACLEEAKELVRRFTYVLDLDCLGESMIAFANELGFDPPSLKKARYHPPVRDRINNTEIYNYMRHRMRRDLELYSWSKSLSLVNCSAIESSDSRRFLT